MNEDRLQDAFQDVRQTFFPRWDKKGEWKVVDSTRIKASYDTGINEFRERVGINHLMEKADMLAECCEWGKVINIFEIPDDDDRLHELLIHEICHVKALGHGKKWARNMEKAYFKAVNNPNVSEDLTVSIDCDMWEFFDDRLD